MPSCASASCFLQREDFPRRHQRRQRAQFLQRRLRARPHPDTCGNCNAVRLRQLAGDQSVGQVHGAEVAIGCGHGRDAIGMLQCSEYHHPPEFQALQPLQRQPSLEPLDAEDRQRRGTPRSPPRASAATNQTRLHAGIDRPRKVQSTLAHSPEPVITLRISSEIGIVSTHEVQRRAAGWAPGPAAGAAATRGGRRWRCPPRPRQRQHAIDAAPAVPSRRMQAADQEHQRRARRTRCAGRCTAGTAPADPPRGTAI